jgi:peptidoglycan/LPS O-acetylase OafA/YrhL
MACNGLADMGALCGNPVFVLSGFSLMYRVQHLGMDGGASTFFKRRAWRILPPYYFALLLSLLVVHFIKSGSHTLFDASLPVTKRGVLSHLFMVHNLSPATRAQINGPFWSIAVETQIYLFFPLLISVRKRIGSIALFLYVFSIGYIVDALIANLSISQIMPHYYAMFAAGMLAAEIALNKKPMFEKLRRLPWGTIATLAGAGLAVLCHRWYWQRAYQRFALMDIVAAVTAIGILVKCADESWNGWFKRLLECHPAVWLGGFSYSLYLIHFPLQQLLYQVSVGRLALPMGMRFAFMATVGTAVMILAAKLFYEYCEKPFTRSYTALAAGKK